MIDTFFTHNYGNECLITYICNNYCSRPWKSISKETTFHCYFSLNFIHFGILKCSKKLGTKDFEKQEADCEMLHCKTEQTPMKCAHDFHISTKNSSTLKLRGNECVHNYASKGGTEKEANSYDTIANSDIHNEETNRTVSDPVVSLLSDEENNYQHNNCTSNNNKAKTLKKNACVQTSKRYNHKSQRRKLNRNEERNKKPSISDMSTNALSKDIETIFTTNTENFNSKKSNMDMELLGTQYMKEISSARKRKSKGTNIRSKRYDAKKSSYVIIKYI